MSMYHFSIKKKKWIKGKQKLQRWIEIVLKFLPNENVLDTTHVRSLLEM